MEEGTARALVVDPKDNVATMLTRGAASSSVVLMDSRLQAHGSILLCEAIPIYHKVAIRSIPSDDVVVKFGETIGRATSAIPSGAHVHVQNVASVRLPGS